MTIYHFNSTYDYNLSDKFRRSIKRRFKLCRCDVALISIVVCFAVNTLGGVL